MTDETFLKTHTHTKAQFIHTQDNYIWCIYVYVHMCIYGNIYTKYINIWHIEKSKWFINISLKGLKSYDISKKIKEGV